MDPKAIFSHLPPNRVGEIESHAHSDTNVELGGVLLGGQYEDEEGRPFVLVADSLRAKHYESDRGHFKFTHDTWSQIGREQEGFSDDLKMVGWYHTHPGWGVFLSGMDTFICDNFFNKPLDVALVVDPVRDDRGLFHRDEPGRQRQADSFFVVSSRLRLEELEDYVARLEGKDMTRASETPEHGYEEAAARREARRMDRPRAGPPLSGMDRRVGWVAAAVGALLVVQTSLLLLIAVRVGTLASRDEVAREAERVAAQRALLAELIGRLDVAPEGLIDAYEQQRRQNDQLSAAVRGFGALQREYDDLQASSRRLAAEKDGELQKLKSSLEATKARLAKVRAQLGVRQAGETKPDGSGKAATLPAAGDVGAGSDAEWRTIRLAAWGALLLSAAAAVFFAVRWRNRRARSGRAP